MTKQYDIIHLPKGMVVVDKSQRPIDRTVCIGYHKTTGEPSLDWYYEEDESYYVHKCSKIIAASPSLNLEGIPLLPKFTDNVFTLAAKYVSQFNVESNKSAEKFFIAGYKANPKQYTKEDILEWYKYVKTHTVEEAFEHLHKTKLPKAVVLEMEVDADDKRNWYEDVPTGKYWEDTPVPPSRDRLYTNAQYLKPKTDAQGFVIVNRWIF